MVNLHLALLALTALVILYSDHVGWQYFRGTTPTIDGKVAQFLHYAVWAGLISMIMTGAWMAYPALSFLIAQPVFLLKMLFVVVLVLNSFLISSLMKVATVTPYASLTPVQKAPLIISGALSTVSWVGATVVAFIFFGW